MKNKKSELENRLESSGKVTVTAIQNGKVIQKIEHHNEGTAALCRYLRDCCIGQCVISERPGRIIPCVKDTTQTHNLRKLFSYGIQYQPEGDKKLNYDYSASAVLRFLIPYTVLASQSKIHGFYLCSDSSNLTEYAYVELTDDQDIIIKKDTNVLVEWKINLSYVKA